jgi:hypothetical protein
MQMLMCVVLRGLRAVTCRFKSYGKMQLVTRICDNVMNRFTKRKTYRGNIVIIIVSMRAVGGSKR